jgi:uncharacterized delta-60 repeat protein
MKMIRLAAIISAGIIAFADLSHAQSGTIDLSFNPGSGASDTVACIAIQTNGQIVVGGSFAWFNGTYSGQCTRLNADGSLDLSFGPVVTSSVGAIAVQPDGKILIAGGFGNVNGVTAHSVARLRPDGSVDNTFSFLGAGGLGSCMALQPDGKLLIGGAYGVARLNSDGSVDSAFNPNLQTYFTVNALALQSDGRIIVGGSFYSIGGIARHNMARLNTDGSVDTNFDAAMTDGGVNCIAVTSGDKILVGGQFSGFSGYSRNNIARLNADGSVDNTFRPGQGPNFAVIAMGVQVDGKVLISGPTSQPVYRLTRLNADGSIDDTFALSETYSAADGAINCLAVQPDGKTLAGGTFATFSGTNLNRIVRLNGDKSPTNTLQFLAPNQYFGTYLQGTVSNTYRVEWTGTPGSSSLWTPLFNVQLQTNPQFILDPAPVSGQRYYRAVQVSP